MSVPLVAIVGRPNVGKSSIFNWLAGHRLAIVDDVAGVTRDRMTHLLNEEGRYFEIVDTGGIGINDVDDLSDEIEEQISIAIDNAHVILFVVDAREGITGLDQLVSQRLQASPHPVLLVSNKADHDRLEQESSEFYTLGHGEPICVSAREHRHRSDLMDAILEQLPDESAIDQREVEEPEMKIAIVGRRNVGKSTFVNTLAQSDRMIVSEVAGTTRDSVDVRFEMDGKTFVAIDTPGLRKTKSVRTDIEYYSSHRARRSIRHADVVLMFFDAASRMSNVDRQLCNYIADECKPCILVVNKWDKMEGELPTSRWADYLMDNFPNLSYVPIAFITGMTGKNVKRLLNHAQMLFKQSQQRVSTGELNRMFKHAIQHHAPPMHKGRRPKIFYATQVSVQPPTIVTICNDPKAFAPTYKRYLLGALRDQVPFAEVPIKLYFQKRSQTDLQDAMETSEPLEEDASSAADAPDPAETTDYLQ
jgi:GTP-binding protein